jgi:hypothetical protein
MRYDLALIREFCREIGLPARTGDQCVEVDLGQGALLCFQNAAREEDCLIGFLDTPWHTHDNLMFADARGNTIELDYLDLLTGLTEGRVLVCEGERIIVRRATLQAAGATEPKPHRSKGLR